MRRRSPLGPGFYKASLYRRRRRYVRPLLALAIVGGLGAGAWVLTEGFGAIEPVVGDASPSPRWTPEPSPLPINRDVQGITTFRGNAARSYLGRGPVPQDPIVLWRFPSGSSMCTETALVEGGTSNLYCGVGWTGQANVVVRDGTMEVRFGANDGDIHFLDGRTGGTTIPAIETGGLAKGSITSDPEGYPLIYAGATDGKLRVIAIDREFPEILWELDGTTSVPEPRWNDDWDGSPLLLGDHLLVGGENGWFYVVRLHRRYGEDGLVRVEPEVVVARRGWDDDLLADIGDEEVSIENSIAFSEGIAYFANSAGLVQGWDVSDVLAGGTEVHRTFRFWMGDDVDATIVIDPDGYLYAASQVQRGTARSALIGQLVKLDPRRPTDPIVWTRAFGTPGYDGQAGIWGTPALADGVLYVPTNAGELFAIDAADGQPLWKRQLHPPTWSSPVVVDGVLIQGDCLGFLTAWDVTDRTAPPELLWKLRVSSGCLEATPVVWRGWIFIGDRTGGFYGISDTGA